MRALVTAIGGGVGQAIMKSLQAANCEVIGVDCDGNALRHGCGPSPQVSELIPRHDETGYLDRLIQVCNDHSVDAIFPGSDYELKGLSASAGLIMMQTKAEWMGPTFDMAYTCRDKQATAAFLETHGFAFPRTNRLIVNRDPIFRQYIFPAILKPAWGSGSRGVYFVEDLDHLKALSRTVKHGEYVVQEYVEGAEFTTTVAYNGEYLGHKTFQREPDIGRDLRFAERRVAHVDDSEILDIARSLWESLGFHGGINLQWRADGRPVVFEINARFPGSTYLCAMAGMNGPARCLGWQGPEFDRDFIVRRRTYDVVIPC